MVLSGNFNMKKHQITLICQYCKKEYIVQFYRKDKSKFCSKHCKGKYIGQYMFTLPEYREKMRIIALKNHNKPPIYKGQNHPRYNPNLYKIISVYCACGCGNKIEYKPIDIHYDDRHLPRYLHGHNLRNLPEESKQRLYSNVSSTRRKKRHLCKTPLYELIKRSIEYKKWRSDVFKRDNWTCQDQDCRIRGGKLEAHHKKEFAFLYQEAISIFNDNVYQKILTYQPLFDIDNGITLCVKCHQKIKHPNYKIKDLLIFLAYLMAGNGLIWIK